MAIITITGVLKDAFNNFPSGGWIVFRLDRPITNSSGASVSASEITAVVSNVDGTFSALLESTTDATPNNAQYTARFRGTMNGNYEDVVLGTFYLSNSPSSQVLSAVINASSGLGGTLNQTMSMSGPNPRIIINENDQGANGKIWDLEWNGGVFSIKTRTDADTAGATALSFTRSGTTLTGAFIGAPLTGPLTVGGLSTLNGGVVFNEDGADVDFRIESDTNANHFNSDGGAFSGVGAFSFGSPIVTYAYFNENSPGITIPINDNYGRHWIQSTNSIQITGGTSAVVGTLILDQPGIQLSGGAVASNVYTLIITAASGLGTNKGSIWVMSGKSRFDGGVVVGATPTFEVNTSGALIKLNNVTVPTGAFTQTYATADKTHANFVSGDLTGITSSTTGTALAEPGAGYVQAEHQQNYRRIQDQFVNLRGDVADVKALVNSIIDDLQSLGIFS